MIGWLAEMSTTRTNYWMGFAFDATISACLLVFGFSRPETDLFALILLLITGLFVFSFIEYFFHRWLFHLWVPVMVRGHGKHHDNPLGYDALPFFVPSLVFFGVLILLQFTMPLANASVIAAAVGFGYITYGLTHFGVHHFRFRNRLAKFLIAYHHIHHYHPGYNFGVTSPLWDIIFRTQYQRQKGHR